MEKHTCAPGTVAGARITAHMIPTPDTSHLRKSEYRDSVYDPAEDTFALIDALEEDANELQASPPRLCVEIG